MKLYSFQRNGKEGIGVLVPGENKLVDLSASHRQIVPSMLAFIQAGESAIDLAKEVLSSHSEVYYYLDQVRLTAP